jgi:hypothetical protein
MDARPDSSPTAVATDGRPAGASQRSRGCLGCLASGSLGCGAFVFGAILAVALFAPQLLGGWAARGAETWLSQMVDGRVTVGGAELSWSDGTRLREVVLVDEADKELLRGTLRGPSLAEFVGDPEGRPPRLWAYLREAHLTIDAARGLDLARVLRWHQLEPFVALWRQQPAGAAGPFVVSIDARELHIVDTRHGRYELVLTDFLLDLERAVGAGATNFKLTCGVEEVAPNGASPASLSVSFHVGAQDQALPSTVELALKAEGLPARAALLLVEALRGGFGAELPYALTPEGFSDIAGERLDLELSVSGDVQAGASVAVSLVSERGEARLAGQLLAGVLRLGGSSPLVQPADTHTSVTSEVRWQVPTELARRVLASLVPEGWVVAVTGIGGAEPSVRARTDALVLDTGFGRGWDADMTLVELAADVPCDLALTLGVAPGTDLAAPSSLTPLERATEEQASATHVVPSPLVLVRWLGPLGGTVTAHWRSEEPSPHQSGAAAPSSDAPSVGSATLRWEPSLVGDGIGSTHAAALTADVDLPGLSVELLRIAASLPAEGAALLGERIRLQVSGLHVDTPYTQDSASDGVDGRALDFALYAGLGRVPVRGRFEGGVARAAGVGLQSLSFPSDRATLARLLGPVLPWIEELEAAGPGPVTVTFDELAVPLDGGVLRPRGSLEFAPPPLRVRLTAPIAAYFGSGEVPGRSAWHPRRIRVELNDEVVRYEAIELPLAGDLFPFKGSFDRATRDVNLQGEVPMRLLQDRDWGGSELAEQLVDSDVPVFVNLSGPIGSPTLFIDWARARAVFSRRLEEALGEVVPAMRGALDQIVPRASVAPQPAGRSEAEKTPPGEPPPASGGG